MYVVGAQSLIGDFKLLTWSVKPKVNCTSDTYAAVQQCLVNIFTLNLNHYVSLLYLAWLRVNVKENV